MKLKIAILAGDGIGPEIMKQGVAVLDAVAAKCGHQFEYEEAICGEEVPTRDAHSAAAAAASTTSACAWAS